MKQDTGNDSFNGKNEKEGLREAHQDEQRNNKENDSLGNEQALGSSVRNFGEVNGTTFGAESSTAKFSNLGDKNTAQNEGNDSNV